MMLRREFDLEVLRRVGDLIFQELSAVDGVRHDPAVAEPYHGKFHCETFWIGLKKKELFLEQSKDGSVPLRLGVYLNGAAQLSPDERALIVDLLISQADSLSEVGFQLTHSRSRRDYESFVWDSKGISDWLSKVRASVGRDIVWTPSLDGFECSVDRIIERIKIISPIWEALCYIESSSQVEAKGRSQRRAPK